MVEEGQKIRAMPPPLFERNRVFSCEVFPMAQAFLTPAVTECHKRPEYWARVLSEYLASNFNPVLGFLVECEAAKRRAYRSKWLYCCWLLWGPAATAATAASSTTAVPPAAVLHPPAADGGLYPLPPPRGIHVREEQGRLFCKRGPVCDAKQTSPAARI